MVVDRRGAVDPRPGHAVIIDYADDADGGALERTLSRLRQAVQRRYAAVGSEQQEIWVIAQRATRHM
jgi:hypothetical protein